MLSIVLCSWYSLATFEAMSTDVFHACVMLILCIAISCAVAQYLDS